MVAIDLAGVIIRVPRREGSALCPCVGVRLVSAGKGLFSQECRQGRPQRLHPVIAVQVIGSGQGGVIF